MKKIKIISAVVLIIAIIIGLVWFFWLRTSDGAIQNQPSSDSAFNTQGEEYKNETYNFSLTLPEGFSAREIATESGSTVLIESKTGDGVQIVITKQDEDVAVLTKEMIEADIPDMKIEDVQPVEVGQNHTGLAFKSDNPSFDGGSREVWFIFNSNLYQISTYARLDPLLKSIFATWEFF